MDSIRVLEIINSLLVSDKVTYEEKKALKYCVRVINCEEYPDVEWDLAKRADEEEVLYKIDGDRYYPSYTRMYKPTVARLMEKRTGRRHRRVT